MSGRGKKGKKKKRGKGKSKHCQTTLSSAAVLKSMPAPIFSCMPARGPAYCAPHTGCELQHTGARQSQSGSALTMHANFESNCLQFGCCVASRAIRPPASIGRAPPESPGPWATTRAAKVTQAATRLGTIIVCILKEMSKTTIKLFRLPCNAYAYRARVRRSAFVAGPLNNPPALTNVHCV